MRLDSKTIGFGELANDRVFLENVRLKCKVGASEKERRMAQEVLVDLNLFFDLKRPGTTDSLEDTVDYSEMMRKVSEFVSRREFGLLESLAEGIAALALETRGVERVTVRVRKAKYSDQPSVGVEIERRRRAG
jgi:FolB domain-containing protein